MIRSEWSLLQSDRQEIESTEDQELAEITRDERLAALEKLPFETVGNVSGKSTTTRTFRQTALDLFRHRQMLWLFIRRDLKSRYKDSALGFTWTLIRPITQLLIYYVVVGKFLGAERGIPMFAIYIFTGLAAFGLFSEIVTAGTQSIVANAGLVKKVYVPRELFPLATTGTAIFNFLIQFAILIAACFAFDNINLSWDLLYLIPSFGVVLTFGFALGLLLAAWNVYLRDVSHLIEVLLMVMLWASPILYSWEMVRDVFMGMNLGWALEIYTNNPITLAILGFQRAIWGTEQHGLAEPAYLGLRLLIALFIGFLLIYLAQRVFSRMQGSFAQEL